MRIEDCEGTPSGTHQLELDDGWGGRLQWPWCRMCGLELEGIHVLNGDYLGR